MTLPLCQRRRHKTHQFFSLYRTESFNQVNWIYELKEDWTWFSSLSSLCFHSQKQVKKREKNEKQFLSHIAITYTCLWTWIVWFAAKSDTSVNGKGWSHFYCAYHQVLLFEPKRKKKRPRPNSCRLLKGHAQTHTHTHRHLHVPCATSKVFFHNFSLKTHDILPFIFLSVHFRRMTSTLFLNEKVINVYALFSCRLKPFFYRAYISFREFVTGRQICSIFLSLAIGDIYRIFLRDKKKVQIIRRHFCTFTLVCLITKFGENANTFKFLFFMKENP